MIAQGCISARFIEGSQGFRYSTRVTVTIRELLQRALQMAVSDSQAAWFEQALPLAAHGTTAQLLQVYTQASRHLGRAPLPAIDDGHAPALNAVPRSQWGLEDAARLTFLLARHEAARDDEHFFADASACFEQGDSGEQQSWLRGIALLPGAERFRPIAIDACRTNILPVFQAIACENPYPARHFPERNFNQMVLKALFNGIALARIVGLTDRANAELARMATDYAAERTAAGRSVPPDISLATAATGAQGTAR
jgi:hypothetical protein